MLFFLTGSGPFPLGHQVGPGSIPLTQPPPGHQQQGIQYRGTVYYGWPPPGYQSGPGLQQGGQVGSNTGEIVQVTNQ